MHLFIVCDSFLITKSLFIFLSEIHFHERVISVIIVNDNRIFFLNINFYFIFHLFLKSIF